MSCNGCRVLRKGCSESCILRPCLQWIEAPESQGHATVFVAKFFGRAGLMAFITAVPENQRPALFQSLLYEACGRTVNPVNGAVGLLWTGNWHVCEAAVETVLRGGSLRPIPELLSGASLRESDDSSEAEVACTDMWSKLRDPNSNPRSSHKTPKRRRSGEFSKPSPSDLDLSLLTARRVFPGAEPPATPSPMNHRPGTPSLNSEESGTTTFLGDFSHAHGGEPKLLDLFP